ncbi:MAG: thiamine phosphate synthase [Ignavibacteria bacterium]|nr:thiamine phosphate synthase [Ignavibacteria bacterium]
MKNKFDLSLYLVTDRKLSEPRNVEEVVELAIQGGVTAVQLREKEISTRKFLETAINLKKMLQPKNIPLIINDRIDIALAIDADGVHIGQEDMPYKEARRILGDEKIIGLSIETFEQAKEAEKLDVDYLGVSPIFQTPTKNELKTEWGIEGLRKLRQNTHHKLIAIGGINANNAQAVLEAGADGIAVVSAICSAQDPKQAAKDLKDIILKTKRAT